MRQKKKSQFVQTDTETGGDGEGVALIIKNGWSQMMLMNKKNGGETGREG